MNRNGKLSENTYGKRHVQPHMPADIATKKKSKVISGFTIKSKGPVKS